MSNLNLICPINQLGYGIVSLNMLKALDRMGAEPALWVIGNGEAPTTEHKVIQAAAERTGKFNNYSSCLRIWHQFDMAQFVGRGKRMGYTFWEMDRLRPVEIHHLSQLDVLFVPSRWAKDIAISCGVISSAIEVLPCAVDTHLFKPGLSARPRECAELRMGNTSFHGGPPQPLSVDWGKPIEGNPTVFLNVGKWEIRKGHDVLLQAFLKAFTPQDNVRLVMNCANPFLTVEDQQEWVRYYKEHELGDKVYVVPNRLPTQADLAVLMAQADCGVFPARAEAWNLDAAEMMAMGKEVIITNYGGHTEFCNDANSRLIVGGEMEPAVDGKWFHGEGRWFAHTDNTIDQMVHHLREVHRLKQEKGSYMNQAGIDTFSDTFTWDKSAQKVLKHA
jgi:glycosyltransferase involved in cell wall biosynthesis